MEAKMQEKLPQIPRRYKKKILLSVACDFDRSSKGSHHADDDKPGGDSGSASGKYWQSARWRGLFCG